MTKNIISIKGKTPVIAMDAFIAPSADVIGDVVIGEKSSVWFNCVVRGDVYSIRIGKRSNIQDGTIIHVSGGTHPTTIGDDVLVGHNCIIHGCTLEDASFVGMGTTILDGVVVESGGMVAAGALVTPNKRIPSGELWGGS
ncbi:MAG TPA: gamma carbonic anhydrase family protein, partial [Hyphomonas sp.]|nr:gamma carbonic anhydrase family protein [Hyphomonas sp.]